MDLPSVKDLPVANKKVLLRTNYDVPLKNQKSKIKNQKWEVADTTRIEESLPTINFLLKQKAKVIILSHLGRPGGKIVPELSLAPVAQKLKEFLNSKLKIKNSKLQFKIQNFNAFKLTENLILLENLRFYPEEEENNLNFAQQLALLGDFYVNDAFACSHRKHASIVGLPQFLPSAFGLDFLKEVEVLDKVRSSPRRPVVVILGGVKKDKILAAQKLAGWADWILIGGKLVEYEEASQLIDYPKIVGSLIRNGQDITMETVRKFEKVITLAKTIVWAGPMGDFYHSKYLKGTKAVAQAVAQSKAFTVVGGGDTEAALTKLGLVKKISFISSGGGAMLEFLAKGTLPGIQAVL